MAGEAAKEGGYSIILTSIRGGANLTVAAAELSRTFSLDLRVATQIIRKAPIILFKEVLEQEVQAGKSHLVALSRFGMDFRVTTTPPVNLPKVNWPSKPDLHAIFSAPPPPPPAPVVATPQEITVQVLCPCCGSTLRMRIEPAALAASAPGTVREDAGAAGSAETPGPGIPAEPVPDVVALPIPAAGPQGSPVQAVEKAPPAEPPPSPAPVPVPLPALVVTEAEADRPWTAGPYAAVPVDGIQEDLEFSRLGGPSLAVAPLFSPSAPVALRPKSSPALKPAPKPSSSSALPAAPTPSKAKAVLAPPSAPEKPSAVAKPPAEPKEAPPEERLVEVEARDASGGIEEVEPDTEKVVPVEPEPEAAAPKEAPKKAPEDDLVPWTGPARTYKAKPESPPPAPLPDTTAAEEENLQPWTGPARSYKAKAGEAGKVEQPEKKEPPKPAAEGAAAKEALEPWTGSARTYKAKPGEAGKKEPKAPPPAAPEPKDEEEKLEPWTGPARSYKAKKEPEAAAEAPPKPAEAAPVPAPELEAAPDLSDEVTVADAELQPKAPSGADPDGAGDPQAERPTAKLSPGKPGSPSEAAKAIGETLDDIEDIPEINLAEPGEIGMGKALVADVEEKSRPGLEEGLEDVPEIQAAEKAEPSPGSAKAEPPRTTVKKIKLKRKSDTVATPAPAKAPEPAPEPAPAEPAEAPGAQDADEGGEGGEAEKEGGAGEGGSDYSVFLSKIVSADRRRKAVEILCEIKGISEKEAETLTTKMIIPVVKGVDKDQAESILEQFKKNKISGRITRKK
ncbi:MAG: hypothetical protein MUC63_03420 [Planctomycetes bacterium]|nr:hypothetical protein [Planctomycetota bacterium]